MNENMVIYIDDIDTLDKEFIIENCDFITVDTETTGLDPIKDELCLIQIYDGFKIYIIKYDYNINYSNLKFVLKSNKVKKVFHHANFDLRFLMNNLKTNNINNVVCTKISAKLLNGINEKNGLQYLVKKYLNINMNKDMQTSKWKGELSIKQIEYAKNDVVYLYELWKVVEKLLIKQKLYNIAQKCFDYLPINSQLHNKGIENIFIY